MSAGTPAKRVLIVGGGPIGLCLAADLGARGISCLLIEQNDNRTRSARIMQISVGSMEICRRFGIAHHVRNWGFPQDYPFDNVWVTSLNGYELARVKWRRSPEPIRPRSALISVPLSTNLV